MARNPDVPWENPEPVAPERKKSKAELKAEEEQKKADEALFGGTKAGNRKETPFKTEAPESMLQSLRDKDTLESELDKKDREFESLEAAAAAKELEEKIDRVGEIFAEVKDLDLKLTRQGKGMLDMKALEKYGRLTDAMVVEKTDEAIGMIESAKKDIERGGADPEAVATDLADLEIKLQTLRNLKEVRIKHSGIETAKKNIDSIIVDPEVFKNEKPPMKKVETPKPSTRRPAAMDFPPPEKEEPTIKTRREDGTFEADFGFTPENPAKKPKSLWEKGLDLIKGKGKKE